MQMSHTSFCLLRFCYTTSMSDAPYEIGSGLTEQELQVASWWVRHRPILTRIGYGFLMALIACTWISSIWMIGDAYIFSYGREQKIQSRIAETRLTRQTFDLLGPQALIPQTVDVLTSTDGRLDFSSSLSNPNGQWTATLRYAFRLPDGTQTPWRMTFILPSSVRPLTEIGWAASGTAHSAELTLDWVRWRRLDPQSVGRDYASFAETRLQLHASDIVYARDLVIGSTRVGQSSFTLKNASAYGFWAVDLTVRLYRGSQIVAVTTVTERQIRPGETRPITIHWYENLSDITRTEIEPVLNILDPDTYVPERGA